jgi:hypothetical protein
MIIGCVRGVRLGGVGRGGFGEFFEFLFSGFYIYVSY